MPREIIVEFPSPLTDKEKKMVYGYKGEVVRCKNCIHCTYDDKQLLYLCDYTPFDDYVQVMPLDYCSWGERREDGKAD